MTLHIGAKVRVLPPFDTMFPCEHEIVSQSETGAWQIAGNNGDTVDFAPEHIEVI